MRSPFIATSPTARGSFLALASLFVLPLLAACGSRGDPRPPVYPNPPPVDGLTAAQRGTFGILRFPPPALRATIGAEEMELESVEVLVYAERYPPLSVETLIAGLERRRDVMILDAAAEAAAAEARAAVEAATAAGEPPPPPGDPNAPVTTVRRRNPDEDAIFRLPVDLREQWRLQGLSSEAELLGARRLAVAVDALWARMNLPATVLASGQPQPLPDPGEIARASEEILQSVTYERQLPVGAFLGRASISRRIPIDQWEGLLVDGQLQVAIPVGVSTGNDLRTRYFFAARGRSTRNTPGEVASLVALAPAPVPVPPADVTVLIGAGGVELSWDPPAGDMALRRLDPDAVRYNVYRMLPDGIAGPQPLNASPLDQTTYTDGSMQWDENYVYEVRAVTVEPGPIRRESEGLKTSAFRVVDRFPPAPPTEVDATRAGSRVSLRWTPSVSIDLIGYRVYRHAFPAPTVPSRFDPTSDEEQPGFPPGSVTATGSEDEAQAPNEMVQAGWELLTEDPVPFSRYTDNDNDPSVRYVYAIEAVDGAGNLSALALGTEPGDRKP